MKRAIALALSLGFAGALVGAPASAQPQEGARAAPPSERMHAAPASGFMEHLGHERPLLSLALRNRTELALSDEQVKTLQGLVERFGKSAEPRVRDIEAAERDIAALLAKDSADLAQVEAKVRALEKARADLRVERIRTIAEGRAALSAEQRTKLDQLAAEHGGQRRGTRSGQG